MECPEKPEEVGSRTGALTIGRVSRCCQPTASPQGPRERRFPLRKCLSRKEIGVLDSQALSPAVRGATVAHLASPGKGVPSIFVFGLSYSNLRRALQCR